jgi:hypothetical protein
MRKILFASAFALFGLAVAAPAEAMPFPPLGAEAPSAIVLTAGGCGIGFHRGPWGGCRPNGGYYGYRPYAYGYRPYAPIARTPTAMAIAPTAFTAAAAGGAAECASALEARNVCG